MFLLVGAKRLKMCILVNSNHPVFVSRLYTCIAETSNFHFKKTQYIWMYMLILIIDALRLKYSLLKHTVCYLCHKIYCSMVC